MVLNMLDMLLLSRNLFYRGENKNCHGCSRRSKCLSGKMKLVPGVQSVCRKDPFELGGFQVADAAGQVAAGAGAAAAAADGAAGGLLIML